jgi:two-component system, NarL family, sensor histidine kinase UhpB
LEDVGMATLRSGEDAATWRDGVLIAAATLAFAFVSAHFELGETIAAMTRPRERFQLDELPATLLVMALGLAWFAWRRMREARTALRRQVAFETELTTALAENRRLERANVRIQEEERKNLARELHDELGQYLNAIKVDAVCLRDAQALDVGEVKRGASLIVGIVDHLQIIVRDLVRRLRPAGLDELGLAAAIEDCLDGWRRRMPATNFECHVDAGLADLGEAVNMALFRIVQEGLTNVARHAQASHVAIHLEQEQVAGNTARLVRLCISDDGVGIAHLATPPARGLGLVGMRERVESLGGNFEASNAAGGGFRIAAQLPIQHALA